MSETHVLESLLKVARVTTQSASLDGTARNVLEIARDLTAAEFGSLFLFDEQGAVSYSIVIREGVAPEEERQLVGTVMKDGLAGWVNQRREIAIVDDTASDPRWLELPSSPYAAGSALAVPIMHSGGLVGILTLLHREPRHFTAAHAHLMRAAADQMALAARNAQMYERERQLAAEMARARDEAERASQAKSMFLATMSHELRTPLNAILGYSEILKEDAQEQGDLGAIPVIERIETAGKQLLAVINDILDLSKIEAGKLELNLEPVNVAALLRDVEATIAPLAAKNNNRLSVEQAAEPISARADPTKLRQALLNILGNAAKFTENGAIALRVAPATIDGARWLAFAVRDTGIGIAPEQLAQLFQSFTQADRTVSRKYGGTGLGLALSRRFCQLMGGDILVESAPGQGSTFTIILPEESDEGR